MKWRLSLIAGDTLITILIKSTARHKYSTRITKEETSPNDEYKLPNLRCTSENSRWSIKHLFLLFTSSGFIFLFLFLWVRCANVSHLALASLPPNRLKQKSTIFPSAFFSFSRGLKRLSSATHSPITHEENKVKETILCGAALSRWGRKTVWAFYAAFIIFCVFCWPKKQTSAEKIIGFFGKTKNRTEDWGSGTARGREERAVKWDCGAIRYTNVICALIQFDFMSTVPVVEKRPFKPNIDSLGEADRHIWTIPQIECHFSHGPDFVFIRYHPRPSFDEFEQIPANHTPMKRPPHWGTGEGV